MASNLGLKIYELVHRFARKQAMKPGKSGIMQIANPEIVKDTANEILEKFIKHGVPKEVIKTENDVKVIYNQIKSIESQALQHRVISPGDPRHKEVTERIFGKKTGEVFDLTGKKIDTSKPILGGKNVEVDMVSETIENMHKMTPIDAMKEANKVIGRKGKYKNLTIEQSQDILKKTDDHIFERHVDVDPEDLAYGGVAGMLGERTRYASGSNGEDDSMVGISMSIEERWERIKKILKQMEDIKSGKTTDPDPEEKAYGGLAGMLGEPTYADGGRIGFKLGGIDKARRAFLQAIGAGAAGVGAAKSGLFGLLKAGKPAIVKDLTSVPIGNAAGMPAWFKPLVNKVIKEGDDVTKNFATKEREIVHQISLEGKIGSPHALGVEDIRVTQSLDDGTIRVQYNSPDTIGEAGVELVYKKGEEIPTKKGSVKTKDEFSAVEDDFYPQATSPDGDFDLEFTENVVNKVDDLYSDTSKLKQFATGEKLTIKEISEATKKKNIVKEINDNPNEHAFRNVPDYDPYPEPDDFASGGRVPLGGGGGLMKLLKLLKPKPKKSYENIDLEKLLKGKDKIPVYSGSMKRQSNTWQSFIEDAKQLGTTPEKIAKDKFKDQWFTPFRSYAESFTNPKDLTSKMRTVDLDPKEIAIAKRYVEKVNKKDLLASMRRKLNIKPYPKHMITTDENLVLIPRYKLKKLKKENRIMTDYLIKDKIKSKLGLAEGGLAGMLGE